MLVAFISIMSLLFIVPDNTLSFSSTSNNLLSPVSDDVSNKVFPFIIIPSTGIFSPFLIIRISSIFTSSTDIFLMLLFSFLLA